MVRRKPAGHPLQRFVRRQANLAVSAHRPCIYTPLACAHAKHRTPNFESTFHSIASPPALEVEICLRESKPFQEAQIDLTRQTPTALPFRPASHPRVSSLPRSTQLWRLHRLPAFAKSPD